MFVTGFILALPSIYASEVSDTITNTLKSISDQCHTPEEYNRCSRFANNEFAMCPPQDEECLKSKTEMIQSYCDAVIDSMEFEKKFNTSDIASLLEVNFVDIANNYDNEDVDSYKFEDDNEDDVSDNGDYTGSEDGSANGSEIPEENSDENPEDNPYTELYVRGVKELKKKIKSKITGSKEADDEVDDQELYGDDEYNDYDYNNDTEMDYDIDTDFAMDHDDADAEGNYVGFEESGSGSSSESEESKRSIVQKPLQYNNTEPEHSDMFNNISISLTKRENTRENTKENTRENPVQFRDIPVSINQTDFHKRPEFIESKKYTVGDTVKEIFEEHDMLPVSETPYSSSATLTSSATPEITSSAISTSKYEPSGNSSYYRGLNSTSSSTKAPVYDMNSAVTVSPYLTTTLFVAFVVVSFV